MATRLLVRTQRRLLHGSPVARDAEFYRRIKANNAKWANLMLRSDPAYFDRLSQVQTPHVLWIGCADSRIPPTDVTGLLPGDIFVHRNVANLVHPADVNFLSVLQYAVEVLEIPEIVVCGHYGCGGVRHAMTQRNNGLINKWLKPIKDTYIKHQAELDAISDTAAREKRLIELNVAEQVMNVCATSYIQRAWHKNSCNLNNPESLKPNVHGWVYDLHTGLVRDLEIDLTTLPQLHRIDFSTSNGTSFVPDD